MHRIINIPIEPSAYDLAKQINMSVHRINVLMRQLSTQADTMQSAKRDCERNAKRVEELEVKQAALEREIDYHQQVCEKKEQERASLHFFQFIKLKEIKAQIKELKDNIVRAGAELDAVKSNITKTKQEIGSVSGELKEVRLSNYRVHVANLLQEVATYSQLAGEFRRLTSVELAPIKAEDLIIFDPESKEIPAVRRGVALQQIKMSPEKMTVEQDEYEG